MTGQISITKLSAQGPHTTLAENYAVVRGTTESLCQYLSAEDQMLQSMPEASPAKWHLAHTTWFYETFILKPHNSAYQEFHPDFTFLFNSYYKQLGAHPNRDRRGLFSRPSLPEVLAYREHVDTAMLRLISRSDELHIRGLIELGVNHEQQHQELIITDVKHAFWNQPLRPAFQPHAASAPTSKNVPRLAWLDYHAGTYEVGHCGDGFAFDNEGPRHRVYLRDFRLASRPVTNGEYLQFMADGGYSRPELWLSDGWDTCLANGWSSPLYWEEHDGRWDNFTCAGMRELNPAEPVCHVSYYEADAFARWAGARLASEFEWEIVAAALPITGNFLGDGRFHPVLAASGNSGAPGQMFGDVWEWTASPYVAYPGFRSVGGALGEYNGKFMCNQLVLRGGSCATPRSHIRATYRNFFPPQARWQFTGIRLANDCA